MNRSLEPLLTKTLSHIYIEQKIVNDPRVVKILKRLKRSKVVEIGHYKELFNPSTQNYRAQKESVKLILAKKEEPFFYKGSYFTDDFEYEQFFYTPTMLNCLYDCHYCYLQGMYPSGNMVLFINNSDFIDSIKEHLGKPTLVAISYDTDLLAFENISHHVREWIEFAYTQQNLHLEVRTKSANFRAISNMEPNERIVLAWTLSPQEIIELYEPKTPSLKQRISSINSAIERGWRVRICIDPLIYTEQFFQIYPRFIDELFEKIDSNRLYQLTLGVFRMSSEHLKPIKKMAHTPIAFFPYSVQDSTATYPSELSNSMIESMLKRVKKYIPKEKIRVWDKL